MEKQELEREHQRVSWLKRVAFSGWYFWKGVGHFCLRHFWMLLSFILIGILTLIWGLFRACEEPPFSISVGFSKQIELTPNEVRRIQEIGQWEFLSISTEELVDTLQQSLLFEKRLVRIYQGTLRLGVDLAAAEADWVTADQDTVRLKLPAIRILDRHFIDEARTRAFYEKGTWSAETRDQMLQRARERMITRCYTPANIGAAEVNARAQFTTLFQSFGFSSVVIEFEE